MKSQEIWIAQVYHHHDGRHMWMWPGHWLGMLLWIVLILVIVWVIVRLFTKGRKK